MKMLHFAAAGRIMRIFVTGATGFVGSAVVQDLLQHDHKVLGLARSEKSARALKSLGVDVLHGDIEDLASLREGARQCDGVIHTAFNTAFSENETFAQLAQNSENDRTAIEAMGQQLEGSKRPLLVTTGTATLKPGSLSDEDDSTAYPPEKFPRVLCEYGADAVASRGVHVSVIRLSPTVHGEGDHGFVPLLIRTAREKGFSAYIGEGLNRWSAVHRLDAARLYRLALNNTKPGKRFHAAAEPVIPFRDIAHAIARGLGIPVVSIKPEEAAIHFGWFKFFAELDAPAASDKTRSELSWHPMEATLATDLAGPHYFEPPPLTP
jgi:nucleoside-diphosphate-sugar epimerase